MALYIWRCGYCGSGSRFLLTLSPCQIRKPSNLKCGKIWSRYSTKIFVTELLVKVSLKQIDHLWLAHQIKGQDRMPQAPSKIKTTNASLTVPEDSAATGIGIVAP